MVGNVGTPGGTEQGKEVIIYEVFTTLWARCPISRQKGTLTQENQEFLLPYGINSQICFANSLREPGIKCDFPG